MEDHHYSREEYGRIIMNNTRSYRRFTVLEKAESIVQIDETFVHVDSVVVDISRGGFSIRSDMFLPPGTPVLTMLPFIDITGFEDIAVLTGKVLWSSRNESHYLAGIRLREEIFPEHNQGLVNYYFRNGLQC
jgi:hypothetical protein